MNTVNVWPCGPVKFFARWSHHERARPQAITEVLFPPKLQGINGTNNDRIPFAYRVTLSA
jgi:hypothetical protein